MLDVDDLTPAGRAALAACREAMAPEALRRNAALVEAYVFAVETLDRTQRRHRREGSPLLSTSPRGVKAEHPLVTSLRRQTAAVEALAKTLRLTPTAGRATNQRAPDVVARQTMRRVK